MTMARGMNQAIASTARWLGDQITDWTGLAALRVALAGVNGVREGLAELDRG